MYEFSKQAWIMWGVFVALALLLVTGLGLLGVATFIGPFLWFVLCFVIGYVFSFTGRMIGAGMAARKPRASRGKKVL